MTTPKRWQVGHTYCSGCGLDLTPGKKNEPVDTPTEMDYRSALHMAGRALMHAEKWLDGCPVVEVEKLVKEARSEVSRVLDIGRDEGNEMVAT